MAKTNSIPVRLDPELDKQLAEAAKELGLSKQDMIRKAAQLGLPIFRRTFARALAEARGEIQPEGVAA